MLLLPVIAQSGARAISTPASSAAEMLAVVPYRLEIAPRRPDQRRPVAAIAWKSLAVSEMPWMMTPFGFSSDCDCRKVNSSSDRHPCPRTRGSRGPGRRDWR